MACTNPAGRRPGLTSTGEKLGFFRRRKAVQNKSTVVRVVRGLHRTLQIVLLLLVVDGFYLSTQWPDWQRLKAGPVPKSNFIRAYAEKRRSQRSLPPLKWHAVALGQIPEPVQRAAIVGEDSRFYFHSGFDLMAFREAMGHNLDKGRFAFGASTISQQTVKNLFLSSARNPLRKWHELIITWGMEHNLKKDRILELYLNIAEFAEGVYGVEAAAMHYWGQPVSELSLQQAAELAACLPSPKKDNPATRSKMFERRVEKILYWLERQQPSKEVVLHVTGTGRGV